MIALARAVLAALQQLFADAAARSVMVVSIVIYALLYPQPYTAEVVRDVPVAVVDQDGSTTSRALIRRIDAAESARVAATVADLPAAQALFFARKVSGVVIVPPDFERDLLNGEAAPIAAFGDASYFLIYSSMMGAVSTAARSLGAEIQLSRLTASGIDPGTAEALVAPVTITPVALFNPQGGYASYVVPAAFVLILQQTLVMGIGILHAGRKPASGLAMIAAPLAYVLLYSLWIAATQMILPALYGFPRLGTWRDLYIVAVPFLMAVTAMGFAIAQLVPWREGVVFFIVVMGLPLFFLSGVSWPIESIPAPLHLLALLIPSTSAMTAFVQIDQMGAPLAAVTDKVLVQLALTVGYTLIALGLNGLRTRRLQRAAPITSGS
jgi:ABC-2 type transport system permease protein